MARVNYNKEYLVDILEREQSRIKKVYEFDIESRKYKKIKKDDMVSFIVTCLCDKQNIVEDDIVMMYMPEVLIHYDMDNNDIKTGKVAIVHISK